MTSSLKKCPKCRQQSLGLAVEDFDENIDHDGREYRIVIPQLTLLKCVACGNRILPEEADERVSGELRRVAGLLNPSQIKSGRNNLGLTQKQLAKCLAIAEETLSRWETGAQIQQRAFDLVLRAFFAVPEFRNYLGAMEKPGCSQFGAAENPALPVTAPPVPTSESLTAR